VHPRDVVGQLDARDLRVRGADAGRTAVVPRDDRGDLARQSPTLGQQRPALGVVDAEALALGEDALGAGRELARQGVAGVRAEDLGQDELADVVQEPGEVHRVGGDAGLLGRGGGADGDGDRVEVQLPA
jgi:hypothetical protein